MALCDVPDCDEHYGCRLKRKGIMVSAAASATMRNDVPPRKIDDPSWERGIAVDRRRNGEVMPIMDTNASRYVRMHEMSEKRHQIEGALARAKGNVT